MKKNISDHLAKAFFEKTQGQAREKSFLFFIALSLTAVVILVFLASLLIRQEEKGLSSLRQSITLEKYDGPFALDFDFKDSFIKLETLNIALPEIDLSGYKSIIFSVRAMNADSRGLGAFKVGFFNKRRETSYLYIRDIDNSWKRVEIPFSEFKDINNWTYPLYLFFTLEEWNLHQKEGELLIDKIEFSKK